MISSLLKYLLRRRMQKEYKKTESADYSDCGFPIEHLGRDLHLTFLKILDDKKMRRRSLLSRKAYQDIVVDYYEKVQKQFMEDYCYNSEN